MVWIVMSQVCTWEYAHHCGHGLPLPNSLFRALLIPRVVPVPGFRLAWFKKTPNHGLGVVVVLFCFLLFIYFTIHVLVFACMCVCAPCACLVPTEVRSGGWILWNWSYRWLWVTTCWELNPRPLQKQQVPLTSEPTLWTPVIVPNA